MQSQSAWAAEQYFGSFQAGRSTRHLESIDRREFATCTFGDTTKAALITRGLAEITRLGTAMGARPETFSGLSGLGDLIVTCTSRHSRNRYVGEQIGRGRKLKEIVDEMRMVAEGVTTTESAYELSRRMHVEMPIVEQVYQILFREKETREAIGDLMTRSTKPENW